MVKQQVSETIRIHLFKPGTFTSASGVPVSFTESNLEEIVNSYSNKDEAPLCLGHQENDKPSYGWVEKLEKTAKGVEAIVRTTKEVKNSIANEFYKKVSGSLYLPQTQNNPSPGKLYLKHIALLGATAPAIKGLDPIALNDVENGFIEFSEDILTKQEQKEVDMPVTDKKVEKTSVETAKQEVKAQETKEFLEKVSTNEDIATKNTNEDEAANIAAQAEALKQEKAEFAQQQAQAKLKDIKDFTNNAVANGHIKQDLKQDVTNFMESLDTKNTLDFSDDKQETQIEFFKKFVTSLKTTADFSEVASGNKTALNFSEFSSEQVRDAIIETQTEAAKNGKTLNASQALAKLKGE